MRLVRANLGYNNALNHTIILDRFDQVVDEMEMGGKLPLPWFCFDDTHNPVTVAGDRSTQIATNFLGLEEEWPISIQKTDGDWLVMEPGAYEDLVANTTETGEADDIPTHYARMGDMLYLFPLPNAVWTLSVPCYRRTKYISAYYDEEGESYTPNWLKFFSNLIINKTTLRIMEAGRDMEGLALFAPKVNMDEMAYLQKVEQMRHMMRQYRVGNNA